MSKADTLDYTGQALLELKKMIGNDDVVLQRMDTQEHADVDVLPSGAISLDIALGVGGLPRGRIIEIYGPESSGKTTLTLAYIAQALKANQEGWCLFCDFEHAMDPVYAGKIGVDLKRCVIIQPDSGEQGLNVIDKALQMSRPPLIIVADSVAAIVPKSEMEFEMDGTKNRQPGQQAKLMSESLRKFTTIVGKSGSVLIYINQLREKVGVVFGSPETTPGGKALKYYASVRLDIRAIGKIVVGKKQAKEGQAADAGEVVGNHVRVKVVKLKVAPPFKVAEFDIIFGRGIDESADLVNIGEKVGVIDKVGKLHTFTEIGLSWSSRAELDTLWEDEFFQDSLRSVVRKAVFEEAPSEAIEEAKKSAVTVEIEEVQPEVVPE